MLASTKAVLTAACTVLMLALAVAGASAATLEFEPGGPIDLISLGTINFEFGMSGNVACTLTLHGELRRRGTTITKTVGAQVGSAEIVSVGGCTGGELVAALGLSWRYVYNTILGTLPDRVTGLLIRVVGAQILFRLPTGATCLYTGAFGVLFPLAPPNPYTLGLGSILRADQAWEIRTLTGICTALNISGTFEPFPRTKVRRA